jgi:hypothetical protein
VALVRIPFFLLSVFFSGPCQYNLFLTCVHEVRGMTRWKDVAHHHAVVNDGVKCSQKCRHIRAPTNETQVQGDTIAFDVN